MVDLQVAASWHRVGTAVCNLPAYPAAAASVPPGRGSAEASPCAPTPVPAAAPSSVPSPVCREHVGGHGGLGGLAAPAAAHRAPCHPGAGATAPSWAWPHGASASCVPAGALRGWLCPLRKTLRERSGFRSCFPSRVRGRVLLGLLAGSQCAHSCVLCVRRVYGAQRSALTVCKRSSEAWTLTASPTSTLLEPAPRPPASTSMVPVHTLPLLSTPCAASGLTGLPTATSRGDLSGEPLRHRWLRTRRALPA